MIKFRCPQCQQKIAVNDEGAGCAIPCPTCEESLLVPPESSLEFLPLTRAVPISVELVPVDQGPDDAVQQSSVVAPITREAVAPHLARLMMNRLTQTLLSQRAQLLATQRDSTERVAEIEQRVAHLQAQFQKRVEAYESRIASLEGELAAKETENQELVREKFLLCKRRLEQESLKTTTRVELRDTGFLVGA